MLRRCRPAAVAAAAAQPRGCSVSRKPEPEATGHVPPTRYSDPSSCLLQAAPFKQQQPLPTQSLEAITIMFARGFSSVFSRVRCSLTQRTLVSSSKSHSSSSLLATVAALGAAAAYAASDKSTAHASGDTLPLPECVCALLRNLLNLRVIFELQVPV